MARGGFAHFCAVEIVEHIVGDLKRLSEEGGVAGNEVDVGLFSADGVTAHSDASHKQRGRFRIDCAEI